MNKTAEEIIQQHYPFYDSNITFRDVELNGEQVMKLMEEYAAQFAAPPPASEGELTGEDYRNLIDTHIGRMGELEKGSIKHFIETGTINGSFNLRLVSLINFAISLAKGKAALATLPTREQRGEKEKFAIRFSEWLMIQCEYKNHCVWEYRGEEYTQNELIEIFKRTTPLPSPPKH